MGLLLNVALMPMRSSGGQRFLNEGGEENESEEEEVSEITS